MFSRLVTSVAKCSFLGSNHDVVLRVVGVTRLAGIVAWSGLMGRRRRSDAQGEYDTRRGPNEHPEHQTDLLVTTEAPETGACVRPNFLGKLAAAGTSGKATAVKAASPTGDAPGPVGDCGTCSNIPVTSYAKHKVMGSLGGDSKPYDVAVMVNSADVCQGWVHSVKYRDSSSRSPRTVSTSLPSRKMW